MRIDEQPVLVTVIGEVPVNTARMVADSLDWLP
jgi:sigma-E factor negative regulatory protein RseB